MTFSLRLQLKASSQLSDFREVPGRVLRCDFCGAYVTPDVDPHGHMICPVCGLCMNNPLPEVSR
ncbi:MAG: hypothetical protein JRN54_02365 [Nitrososphaerota archaeon]|nr:hypothetical protein [Nitrososphaerota archaeon]MDG7016022.1 hypothetical protein [Nitrososphaerota archaeon]